MLTQQKMLLVACSTVTNEVLVRSAIIRTGVDKNYALLRFRTVANYVFFLYNAYSFYR